MLKNKLISNKLNSILQKYQLKKCNLNQNNLFNLFRKMRKFYKKMKMIKFYKKIKIIIFNKILELFRKYNLNLICKINRKNNKYSQIYSKNTKKNNKIKKIMNKIYLLK